MVTTPDPAAEPLDPTTVDVDPIVQFRRWFNDAVRAGVRQPEAMTLATVDAGGRADARTVLMRGLDERGVAFYTNLESAKAAQLRADPRVGLVFHWREVERQVRVRGEAMELSREDVIVYWETRPRGHRIGAWASPQSEVIDGDELDARLQEIETRFEGRDDVPLPGFWGGFVVAVEELELWQGRKDRLHDRVRYRRRADGQWSRERLAP